MLGDVESVEHDLLVSVRHSGARALNKGLPHVHRDGLDLAQRADAERVKAGLQALPATVLGYFEETSSFEVVEKREVDPL